MQLNYLFCICLLPLALYAHDGDETPPTSEAKKAVLVTRTAVAVTTGNLEQKQEFVTFPSANFGAYFLASPVRTSEEKEQSPLPYWDDFP